MLTTHGGESEVALMWAKWLHNPCILGGLQCSAREKIENGYLTPAVSGTRVLGKWLDDHCILKGPQCLAREEITKDPHVGKIHRSVAFLGPTARHREKIRNGQLVGKVAVLPLHSRSPLLSVGRKSELAT